MPQNPNAIPPHNKEAEQSVLGSILIEKEAIIKIVDLIEPADFYHDTHRLIYEAMLDLYGRHDPIDLLTLANVLEERKLLDKVGGPAYLAELTSSVPTATHVFKYAQIVKHKATLRKMIRVGNVIIGCGYSEDEKLETLLETAEKEVFGITQTFLKDRFVHIRDILNKRFEEFSALHIAESVCGSLAERHGNQGMSLHGLLYFDSKLECECIFFTDHFYGILNMFHNGVSLDKFGLTKSMDNAPVSCQSGIPVEYGQCIFSFLTEKRRELPEISSY